MRQFLKSEKPDLVIAFAQKAIYRALYATLGMKMPVIISVRTNPVGHYDTLADKVQIPLLYPKVAGCVFQTEGQKEFFPKYLQKKSQIILNPINPRYMNVPKPVMRMKEIVQSGRLVVAKNQQMLIRAFLKVHEKHEEYILKIYGGGSEDGTKESLEELIRQNHAESYVKLMGSSDKLEEELVNASVFAFTSDWEGMPNALMEAMALGLPIISTDCPCGGPRTLIENEKNGLLIPVKDEKALIAGINRLIEEPAFAEMLGENARKICEKANAESVICQWREYIEKTIASYR